MATRKSQRIGIWVIAIVLTIGTIGSFAVMILASKNAAKDQEVWQKQYAEALKEQQEQQKELEKEADELSVQYYPLFQPYQANPAAFNADQVDDKVTTNDLRVGEGVTITKDTKYRAYYIGWNPKGKVFDSSFDSEKLKAPIDTSTTRLIEGWSQGVIGMKVGGVREITIPSDLAYGETGSGDAIPPNTPIKFIVMIISAK